MTISASPWILSARYDSCFILAPAVLVSLFAVLFRDQASMNELPSWAWLVLVVGVDAGHVYTTLFRTYFVSSEWQQRHKLLTLVPLSAWLLGCLLYSIDSLVFWRTLAYLAMFHFVRQQYGFMMIYARNERDLPHYYRIIDQAAIYLATLYPLVFWHCHDRTFSWFIADDIYQVNLPIVATLFGWLYAVVLSLYIAKEINLCMTYKVFNIPRNLTLAGTALSWYVGIVAFNNDLIFSATNILAHGIPYYALIWAYGYKQNIVSRQSIYKPKTLRFLFTKQFFLIYIFLMVGCAYLEEGIWDGLIWQEHAHWFGAFAALPGVNSRPVLTWLIPLLCLPQTTHYLLDAYIWRLQKNHIEWKKILFNPLPNTLS